MEEDEGGSQEIYIRQTPLSGKKENPMKRWAKSIRPVCNSGKGADPGKKPESVANRKKERSFRLLTARVAAGTVFLWNRAQEGW